VFSEFKRGVGSVSGLTVSLLPRDHSFLFSEHYGLLALLLCTHAPNANLFFENQPPLDNDDSSTTGMIVMSPS
jgi:hypothetical protein